MFISELCNSFYRQQNTKFNSWSVWNTARVSNKNVMSCPEQHADHREKGVGNVAWVHVIVKIKQANKSSEQFTPKTGNHLFLIVDMRNSEELCCIKSSN